MNHLNDIWEELERWKTGVLSLNKPATADNILEIEERLGRPLPADYRSILERHNGADLRGDRLLTCGEALSQYEVMPSLVAPAYRDDPDWKYERPPHDMFPIAVDLEGNLKCLDITTRRMELVDWHRETAAITSWHSSASAWILTTLRGLSVRFDYSGRPQVIRPSEAVPLERREVEAWLEVDPTSSYARLELAQWLAENATPEEALFAFRHAAVGWPERAVAHYQHGRFASVVGHDAEARRALRRALAVIPSPNPRKHSFRTGYLPAAHELLARLYERVGQKKKAEEQWRASTKAVKKYGFGWYAESVEYQDALRALEKGAS
jgi:tetratricopeptide (TPR) repeat protein